MEREVRYCTTDDGISIAYSATGAGSPVLFVTPWTSTFAYAENEPRMDTLFRFMPGHQVINYDSRGIGMSERNVSDFSRQAAVKDIEAIFRALDFTSAAIVAFEMGCAPALEFAHRYPVKVSHLVMFTPTVVMFTPTAGLSSMHARGKPLTSAEANALIQLVRSAWDVASEMWASLAMPGADPAEARALQKTLRESCSAETAAAQIRAAIADDVRNLLPDIHVPTLIVQPRGDPMFPMASATKIAARMPNARLVRLPFDTHWNFAILEAITQASARFIDGKEASGTTPESAAPFRTVLFTDLVGHTEMMSRLGDERGRDVLREHERITREVLKANGGTEVKTMGDGFMASFGSVTKAVECAIALQRAFADREGEPLNVRVGLNAGEPIEEDGDLFGATVILASRIAAKAGGGEILVADTVRGLCSGKGFLFADRGDFVAKGIEEPVRISEVRWRE